MTLKLRNTWQYQGEDRWDWTAYLDDQGSGELSDVEFVEYVLHPTFPKSIVKVSNPKGGFALTTNGWGAFTLVAFVHMTDGTRRKLSHELELAYEPVAGKSR
ncbi:MAG: hypothetical protein HY680_01945 [Chloroflexi bacterium]|nr:hypothetical protein [Chloroflexota bacterium]